MLQQGEQEPLKASVHALLAALMATCAIYNSCAWARRRETHLLVNALLYSGLTCWELQHVKHHLADHE